MEKLGVAAEYDFKVIIEAIDKAFKKDPVVGEGDEELAEEITDIATKQYESARAQIQVIRSDLNRILRSRKDFLEIVTNKNRNKGDVFRDALAYAKKLQK